MGLWRTLKVASGFWQHGGQGPGQNEAGLAQGMVVGETEIPEKSQRWWRGGCQCRCWVSSSYPWWGEPPHGQPAHASAEHPIAAALGVGGRGMKTHQLCKGLTFPCTKCILQQGCRHQQGFAQASLRFGAFFPMELLKSLWNIKSHIMVLYVLMYEAFFLLSAPFSLSLTDSLIYDIQALGWSDF